MEWRSVVEFKLGIRDDPTVPSRETDQWCIFIDERILDGDPPQSEDGTLSLLTSTSGDLDGDGAADQASIIVHNSRGSGVFYYLNVFLNDGSGALVPAGEAFLGDRIRLDSVQIYGAGSVSRLTGVPIDSDDYGQLLVGYYFHGPNQAYSDDPEMFITRNWVINDGELIPTADQ